VTRAFGIAVQSAYGGGDVSADLDDKTKKKKKKQLKTGAIDDPECMFKHFIYQSFPKCFILAFNAIVRVCLKQLLPAIYRFLRIKIVTTSKLKPETSSNWKYIESTMKKYLLNFTRVCFSFG
jgi:hypothetical protein